MKSQRLIDPERRHHLAVLRGGAHQHAEAGAVEQQPQEPEGDRPEGDEQQVVARHGLAEEPHGAGEAGRAGPEQVVRAPDDHDEVLEHEGEAEGGEELEQLRARGRGGAAASSRPGPRPSRCRARPARIEPPEAERALEAFRQRIGHVGAEHREGAVGEVDDPADAEDDRQGPDATRNSDEAPARPVRNWAKTKLNAISSARWRGRAPETLLGSKRKGSRMAWDDPRDPADGSAVLPIKVGPAPRAGVSSGGAWL